MKVTTLVPYYGSNRTLAHEVGKRLDGCSWVGVPFAGGMSELRHIKARTVLVSDLHKHVLNLARVAAHERLGAKLVRRLRRLPFHPNVLSYAQRRCDELKPDGRWGSDAIPTEDEMVEWAEHYFVAAWMGRNGQAGTTGEFKAGFSVRWDAGGGDSATRYRSAVESLRDWRAALARCTFVVMDVFDFLARVKDEPGHGVYCDPPFPGPGDGYKHKFTEPQHRDLAARLAAFGRCRVVCRFYDHELIRELYPRDRWDWAELEGRKQTNAVGPEVLLTREGSA